ncbi:hypothetical protein D9M71_300380 [compost metagenome]
MRPGALAQCRQGFQAVLAGAGQAALALHHTDHRLVMPQQLLLAARGRLRQEARHVLHAGVHFVEPRADDQRPGVAQDQLRAAGEQLARQLFAPLQELLGALADHHLVVAVALQQADRGFRLLGVQGVLHRLAYLAAAGEPLAGAQVRLQRRAAAGQALERIGQRAPEAEPFATVVDVFQEQQVALQRVQRLHAVASFQQVLAERRIEAWHVRQGVQRLAQGIG